jgi:hypothetical protein
VATIRQHHIYPLLDLRDLGALYQTCHLLRIEIDEVCKLKWQEQHRDTFLSINYFWKRGDNNPINNVFIGALPDTGIWELSWYCILQNSSHWRLLEMPLYAEQISDFKQHKKDYIALSKQRPQVHLILYKRKEPATVTEETQAVKQVVKKLRSESLSTVYKQTEIPLSWKQPDGTLKLPSYLKEQWDEL